MKMYLYTLYIQFRNSKYHHNQHYCNTKNASRPENHYGRRLKYEVSEKMHRAAAWPDLHQKTGFCHEWDTETGKMR